MRELPPAEMYFAIGLAITNWSKLELEFGSLLAQFNGAEILDALRQVEAENAAARKIKLLDKAAQAALRGRKEIRFWNSFRARLGEVATLRHDLAHTPVVWALNSEDLDLVELHVGPHPKLHWTERKWCCIKTEGVLRLADATDELAKKAYGFCLHLAKPEAEDPVCKNRWESEVDLTNRYLFLPEPTAGFLRIPLGERFDG